MFQEEQNTVANPEKEPPRIDVVVAVEEEEICQFLMLDCVFGDWLGIYVKSIQHVLDGLSYLCKQLHQQQQENNYYIFTTIKLTCDRSVNMPQVNVFLDIGVAMNAYDYPDKFSNVLVHLGDFHFMKEIFSVAGTMIHGSGFNDIISEQIYAP